MRWGRWAGIAGGDWVVGRPPDRLDRRIRNRSTDLVRSPVAVVTCPQAARALRASSACPGRSLHECTPGGQWGGERGDRIGSGDPWSVGHVSRACGVRAAPGGRKAMPTSRDALGTWWSTLGVPRPGACTVRAAREGGRRCLPQVWPGAPQGWKAMPTLGEASGQGGRWARVVHGLRQQGRTAEPALCLRHLRGEVDDYLRCSARGGKSGTTSGASWCTRGARRRGHGCAGGWPGAPQGWKAMPTLGEASGQAAGHAGRRVDALLTCVRCLKDWPAPGWWLRPARRET